jgi:hypothetical protein
VVAVEEREVKAARPTGNSSRARPSERETIDPDANSFSLTSRTRAAAAAIFGLILMELCGFLELALRRVRDPLDIRKGTLP